jgi:hypothetical protein
MKIGDMLGLSAAFIIIWALGFMAGWSNNRPQADPVIPVSAYSVEVPPHVHQ